MAKKKQTTQEEYNQKKRIKSRIRKTKTQKPLLGEPLDLSKIPPEKIKAKLQEAAAAAKAQEEEPGTTEPEQEPAEQAGTGEEPTTAGAPEDKSGQPAEPIENEKPPAAPPPQEGTEGEGQPSEPSRVEKKPEQPPQESAGGGNEKPQEKQDDAAKKEEQKGFRAALRKAGQWLSKKITAAATKLAASVGWPFIIGCGLLLIVAIVILIIIGSYYIKNGPSGRTYPIQAGPNDPNVQKLLKMAEDGRIVFLYDRDKQFVKVGKIDKRLAAALAYLAERHQRIRISHIISGYENINTNPESGRFSDLKYPNNISAHKNGQAADIDEVDYVKEKCNCGDDIPVKVQWQTIAENPLGPETPDALNQIKSGTDVTKEPVKGALEKLGVKGLDQKDLSTKIQASQILSQIDSPFDLTNPDVINAFNNIGVTGLDNSDLQTGLKRLDALNALSEMDLHDISALQNPQVQALMAQAGVPVSPELIDNLEKFQAQKVISSIHSVLDLNSPDVQAALAKLGVNSSDPEFKDYLAKMLAADTIKNWQGDLDNPQFLAAMATFGVEPDANMQFAYMMFKAAQNTFQGAANQPNTDVSTVETLEKLAIFTGNPTVQKAIQQFRAAELLKSGGVSWGDANFMYTLQQAGLKLDDNDKEVVNKYQAANYVLSFQGKFTDPQFQTNLKTLGVEGDQAAIEKYIAANTLSKAAHGELAYDSPEVKGALQTIGGAIWGDDKAKAAVNVGDAKDPNDPSVSADKEKIGLNAATYHTVVGKLGAAKNLSHINEYSDLENSEIADDLAQLGLKDPKYYNSLKTVGAIGGLSQIHDMTSLQSPGVKNSLKTLGLDDQEYADAIGKIGSLQTLYHVNDLSDLNSPNVAAAFTNLGVKDPAVYKNVATLGSIGVLLKVDSVWDLGDPQVTGALNNLGVDTANIPTGLSKAGSIYALSKIDSPADLLDINNLQALDNLGIIDLNDQLLGQVGAVKTLLEVDSLKDLMNPSSILALNTLGIIALSNPVTIGLMAVSFIDNLMGGKLLGGIFGGDNCKATTSCYKPAAKENVYKVTSELLQMPYDLGDKEFYRVTQLIVWKLDYIRSKMPNLEQQLNALYWVGRGKNVGLFTMSEAFGNIHIGY